MKRFLQVILGLILLLVGIVGALYAAGITLPWGGTESATTGYLSPTSGNNKDVVLSDSSCINLTSTTNTQYFIPTKTSAESTAFRNNLPSGLSVGSCGGSCNWEIVNSGLDHRGGLPYDCAISDPESTVGVCNSGRNGMTWRCTETRGAWTYWEEDQCICGGNGVCGSANGTATATYPTSNHCSAGTKTDVDTTATDGMYNWRCDGTGGGSNVNCSAVKSSGVPSCAGSFSSNYGDILEDFDLLIGQSIGPKYMPTSPAGKYGSYCIGEGGATCTDTDARSDYVTYLCDSSTPINATCGYMNGTECNVYTAPPTGASACTAGIVSSAVLRASDGMWTWKCLGSGGGTDVNCMAKSSPINYNWCEPLACDFGTYRQFNFDTGNAKTTRKTSCFTPEITTETYHWDGTGLRWIRDTTHTTGGTDDNGYCVKNC